jgi:hypothetical protein
MFLRLQQRLNEIASQTGGIRLTVPMAYIEAVAV